MLTEPQHPVTPPPELVREWSKGCSPYDVPADHIATQAARWGADAELEACCALIESTYVRDRVRAARRPKPPSVAENVSKALDRLPGPGADISYLRNWADREAYGLRCAVRRALKRLQELENQ